MTDRYQEQSHRLQGPPSMGVFFSPPEATKPDTFPPSKASIKLPPIHDLISGRSIGGKASSDTYPSHIHRGPLSPPISPDTKDVDHAQSEPEPAHQRDPVLFPARAVRSLSPRQPLIITSDNFQRSVSDDTVIDLHRRARDAQGWTTPRPSRSEYESMLLFKSNLVRQFNANPRSWINKEVEFLDTYPSRFPTTSKADGIKSTGKRRAGDDGEDTRVKRQRVRKPAERTAPAPRRIARPSPKEPTLNEFGEPVPTKHRRNPSNALSTKDKAKVDRRWQDIPDYCPPISSILPGTKLRIDWKGAPFDLSDDPDRDMVGDAEVELVSVLRLTCAQYLRSKRSIFEKYIEDAKTGKAFNKTAAQGVCQMDVNKASRLYLAFEKVGWFDRHHFQKYLN